MQRTKAIGLLHKQLVKDSSISRNGIPDYLVTMRKPGENADRIEGVDENFPDRNDDDQGKDREDNVEDVVEQR